MRFRLVRSQKELLERERHKREKSSTWGQKVEAWQEICQRIFMCCNPNLARILSNPEWNPRECFFPSRGVEKKEGNEETNRSFLTPFSRSMGSCQVWGRGLRRKETSFLSFFFPVDFQLCSARHSSEGCARARSLHYHLPKRYTFCSVSQNHELGKFDLRALI